MTNNDNCSSTAVALGIASQHKMI